MDEIINMLIRAIVSADKVSPVMLAAVHQAHHRHEMNKCKKLSTPSPTRRTKNTTDLRNADGTFGSRRGLSPRTVANSSLPC